MAFGWAAFVCGAADAFYAPIVYDAADCYGVSVDLINLFATSYFIAYVPTAVPTSWILNKSLWGALLCTNIGIVVGGWIRVVAGKNYGICLLG